MSKRLSKRQRTNPACGHTHDVEAREVWAWCYEDEMVL